MINLNKGIIIATTSDKRNIFLNIAAIHAANNAKNTKRVQENKCVYCKKQFHSKYEVDRHIKNTCEVRKFEDYYNDKHGDKIVTKKQGVELILDDNLTLFPAVRDDRREILFIAGPQGSGKSHYASMYTKNYLKKFKDSEVFIFSRLDEDASFDNIKQIKRIKVSDALLEEDPIDPKKELYRSLTIFDDVDGLQNKALSKYINVLKEDIIKNGRDQTNKGKDIYCIITNHQLTDFHKTRDILNECTSLTFFPKSGLQYQIERVLKLHLGLKKNEIKRILDLPSRWVSIYTTYPQYCIYEKGVFLLGY